MEEYSQNEIKGIKNLIEKNRDIEEEVGGNSK